MRKNYCMNPENLVTRQAKMFSMIESWKSSSENQHSFCKDHSIAYSNFHYWYKKYKEQQREVSGEAFVAIKVKKSLPPSAESIVMELVLVNGMRLNFYQTVDASYLRSLLG